MTERSRLSRCAWTGRQFPVVERGGPKRLFIDDTARAAAHKAARMYTLHLISEGRLTWEELRRWFDAGRKVASPSYTAEGGAPAAGGRPPAADASAE